MKPQSPNSNLPAETSGPAQGVHPSPHRQRVGALAMWCGILGGPAAWSLQQLINAPLFAHGCYPKDVPINQPIWPNAAMVAMTVELFAIVICIVAGLIAWRNWSRTRNEKAGSGHHVLEAGDGRSRFMSMVGMICSGLFLLASVFATAFLIVVHPCNG